LNKLKSQNTGTEKSQNTGTENCYYSKVCAAATVRTRTEEVAAGSSSGCNCKNSELKELAAAELYVWTCILYVTGLLEFRKEIAATGLLFSLSKPYP
jgi:hypothetical protein